MLHNLSEHFVHDTKLITLADPYDEGMNFESGSIKSTFIYLFIISLLFIKLPCSSIFLHHFVTQLTTVQ